MTSAEALQRADHLRDAGSDPAAAIVAYAKVARQWPGTPDAVSARQEIVRLKEKPHLSGLVAAIISELDDTAAPPIPSFAAPARTDTPTEVPTTSVELLRRCPYCAEEILAAAKKCKHCGEFVDGTRPNQYSPLPSPEIVTQPRGEGCFLQTMNLGCVVFFILVAIVIVIAALQR